MLTQTPAHIMLVEDDPMMRLLVTQWLSRDLPGSALTSTGTLHEAVEVLTNNQVEAIILDLTLPDARDLQALDTIMATMRGKLPVPVVILTGRGNHDRWRVLHHGADDLVVKSQTDVRAALSSALVAGWARYKYRLELLTAWMDPAAGAESP